MGLIIKREIQKLMTGFPTVSDKYDVQGGVLGGSTAAHFGDVVVFGSQAGEYVVPTSTISAVGNIAGVVCGTNVKLATTYPAGPSVEVETPAGEAFNLLLKGYIAVELDASLTNTSNIAEGKAVACVLNTASKYGKLTTTGASGATDVPGWYFTGVYEDHGTNAAHKYVAEIVIK